jgi:hypothetical protein
MREFLIPEKKNLQQNLPAKDFFFARNLHCHINIH